MCFYFRINNTEIIVKAVMIGKEQSPKEVAREQGHGHCLGATIFDELKEKEKVN